MFKNLFKIFKSGTGGANSIPNLPVNEFIKKYKSTKDAVLIDARTPSEVAQGKIKGARNLNYLSPEFRAKAEKMDKSKAYFVYCRSGKRSMGACRVLRKMGVEHTYNLMGGYMAYQNRR